MKCQHSLGSNALTGGIPGELGNLARLELLDLSHNQLTGEIPAELHGLARLTGLDLDMNLIDGEKSRRNWDVWTV